MNLIRKYIWKKSNWKRKGKNKVSNDYGGVCTYLEKKIVLRNYFLSMEIWKIMRWWKCY